LTVITKTDFIEQRYSEINNPEDHMVNFRGFIAIEVDSFPKIIEFENEIKNSGAMVKLVEPQNIHITLKFLGDTNENLIEKIEEILRASVENIKPFEISLRGAGFFPNQNYIKVIWIGIENTEQLGQITYKIDDQISKLGFNREKRKFSAHLTVARVKSAKNKDKLIQIIEKYKEIEFGKIIVDSIKLKQSELTPKGPSYTTLKDIKF
jgi:2'-5' RNA ligase